MPIYEYRCRDCQTQFETLVSSTAVDSANCPSCGADEPKRLMSVIAGMGASSYQAEGPVCGAGACEHCT